MLGPAGTMAPMGTLTWGDELGAGVSSSDRDALQTPRERKQVTTETHRWV